MLIENQTLQLLQERALRQVTETGFNPTGIPGLSLVKRVQCGEKRSFQKPYAALIFQGRKRTAVGTQEYMYGPGDMVVTCLDFPSLTTVEEASPEHPFLSAVLELDRNLIAELSMQMHSAARPEMISGQPFFVNRCQEDVAQNFARLMEAAENEESAALLSQALIRELHARLLLGPQGAWIRSACTYGSRSSQIASVIAVLQKDFSRPISVNDLAARAGMSEPSLHRHFKAVTGYSPIQYQKILRLYEGQRILKSGRKNVSGTAFEVGYASSSQFTNDYRRFFGVAPREDRLEQG